MTEFEKVTDGLRRCSDYKGCCGCPYRDVYSSSTNACKKRLMADALIVVEKQGKQLHEWEKYASVLASHGLCCWECGQEITWETPKEEYQ